MKIVIVAPRAASLLAFRGHLLRQMTGLGHEVIVVIPEIHDVVVATLTSWGIRHHVVPFSRTSLNPLADYKYFLHLRDLFRRHQPHLVFSYAVKPVIFGSLAARSAGVPHLASMITGLGYAFTNVSFKQRLIRYALIRLYKRSLRTSRVVIFQNPDDSQLFDKLGIVPKARTAVVNGSGVDTTIFSQQKTPQGERTVFLLMARLLVSKGIREYAEAARILKAQYQAVDFQLLGRFDHGPDGIAHEEIEQWTREGTIHYLGEATDVRPHLAACHAFVLPSYREGTPRSVLEAMSTGRAIITTDAPGCRETVVDGGNGYLVPPRDASALAAAMQRLLDNPLLIEDMGAKSRELVQAKYDVALVNQAMLNALGL